MLTNGMRTVRVAIADAHPMFAAGLQRLLEAEESLTIVGAVSSAAAVVELSLDASPDVLLLDFELPDGSGIDVLERLRASHAAVRTVLLAEAIGGQQIVEAVRLGAKGVVLKSSTTAQLVKCIGSVMNGEYWFGRDRVPDLVDAICHDREPRAPAPIERLTPRQIVVMTAVADGATNRDISVQLGLSEQTVKNHLSHIYDKVGVSNRVELTLFVLHHNLNHGSTHLPPAA